MNQGAEFFDVFLMSWNMWRICYELLLSKVYTTIFS